MESLHNEFERTTLRFNNDNKLIMQAFINFYGGQHKDYVIKKLSEPQIIWYDEANEKNEIKNHIISSLPEEVINECLKKRSEKVFLQSAYIDELDLLILPLSYDLIHIVHEINHKVSSHVISRQPLEQINGISYTIEKGNRVLEYDEFLNESINQRMTLDILDELENLGITTKITSSWQSYLFPFIDLFYDTFKELLKETFISGDLNNFIKLVGEDNYNHFSQLIYLKGFKIRRKLGKGVKPEISQEDVNMIEKIVNEMKFHYDELKVKEVKKY